MKTLMSGVALAAILAFALPIGAKAAEGQQAQTPGQPAATSHVNKGHAAKRMQARHMSRKAHRHVAMRHGAGRHSVAHARPMHRTTVARTGGMSPTDHMANQLNRAENQRLSGGSTPPMSGPYMMAPPAGGASMAPMGAPNQSMQGR